MFEPQIPQNYPSKGRLSDKAAGLRLVTQTQRRLEAVDLSDDEVPPSPDSPSKPGTHIVRDARCTGQLRAMHSFLVLANSSEPNRALGLALRHLGANIVERPTTEIPFCPVTVAAVEDGLRERAELFRAGLLADEIQARVYLNRLTDLFVQPTSLHEGGLFDPRIRLFSDSWSGLFHQLRHLLDMTRRAPNPFEPPEVNVQAVREKGQNCLRLLSQIETFASAASERKNLTLLRSTIEAFCATVVTIRLCEVNNPSASVVKAWKKSLDAGESPVADFATVVVNLDQPGAQNGLQSWSILATDDQQRVFQQCTAFIMSNEARFTVCAFSKS